MQVGFRFNAADSAAKKQQADDCIWEKGSGGNVTRPSSHHEIEIERNCGNCRFSHLVAYKLDLLCFHGDDIRVTGRSGYPVDADCVELAGDEVGMLDGDAYDSVWASRVVDPHLEVCDEWQPEK